MIAMTTVEVAMEAEAVVVEEDAVTMMDTVVGVTILTMNAAVTLAVVNTAMIMATVASIATRAPDAKIDIALAEAMIVEVMIVVADTTIAMIRALRVLAMEETQHHQLASLARPVNLVNLANLANHMAVAPMKVAAVIDMQLGKWALGLNDDGHHWLHHNSIRNVLLTQYFR